MDRLPFVLDDGLDDEYLGGIVGCEGVAETGGEVIEFVAGFVFQKHESRAVFSPFVWPGHGTGIHWPRKKVLVQPFQVS